MKSAALPDLPLPPGALMHFLDIAGDEYALFELPLPPVRLPPGLSRAESEVALAIIEGKSNRDIARRRGTSIRTVANQVRAIYGKLGISGRLALAELCSATNCAES